MFGEGCFWSRVFALWMDSHRHPLSKCNSAGTLCFCAAWWAFIHHQQVLEKRKLEQAAREAALQAEELNGRRRGRTQHSEALPSAPLMLGEIGRSLHHQRQKVRRKPRLSNARQFEAPFNIVSEDGQWPLNNSHYMYLRRLCSAPGKRAHLLQVLKEAKHPIVARLLKKLHSTQALRAYIIEKLGRIIHSKDKFESVEKAKALAQAKQATIQRPCWGITPGLCEHVDADIYKQALACAVMQEGLSRRFRLHREQPFLIFEAVVDRPEGPEAIIACVHMIGGTALSLAFRNVYLWLEITNWPWHDSAPTVTRGDLPFYSRPAAESLPMSLHTQYVLLASPRLDLLEPGWGMQHALSKQLLLVARGDGVEVPWICKRVTVHNMGQDEEDEDYHELQGFEGLEMQKAPAASVDKARSRTFESLTKGLPGDTVLDADAIKAFKAARRAGAVATTAGDPSYVEKLKLQEQKRLAALASGKRKSLWQDTESSGDSDGWGVTSDSSDDPEREAANLRAQKRKAAGDPAATSKKSSKVSHGWSGKTPKSPAPVAATKPGPSPSPSVPALPPPSSDGLPPVPPPLPPPGVPPPAGPAPSPVPLPSFGKTYTTVAVTDSGTLWGYIVYSDDNLNAHCVRHGSSALGMRCHCDRKRRAFGGSSSSASTPAPSSRRAGQGRPLGLLALWLLRSGPEWDADREGESHASAKCKRKLGSFEYLGERKAARLWLEGLAGTAVLFEKERLQCHDEESEPEVAPG